MTQLLYIRPRRSARHNDDGSSPAQRWANFSIVFLFGGFLIYHTAVGAGLVPRLMGGFYTPACLIIAAGFLFLAKTWANQTSPWIGRYSLVFTLFLLFAFTWSLAWFGNSTALYKLAAFYQVINSLFLVGALYMVGAYINLNDRALRRAVGGLLSCIFALLIVNLIITGNANFDARAQFGAGEEIASYQGFAGSTLVIGIIAVASAATTRAQVMYLLMGLVVLFMLISRSEFVGFVLVAITYGAVKALRYRRGWLAAMFVAIGAALVWLLLRDEFLSSRHAELLDLGSSSSAIARQRMADFAWSQIQQSPLVGQFGGQYLAGGLGAYAHNILSAWVTFGFFGFVIYGFLCVTPVVRSGFEVLIRGNRDRGWLAVLMFSVPVLVLILFAKPVFWELPGLLWGLFAQELRRDSLTFAHRAEAV